MAGFPSREKHTVSESKPHQGNQTSSEGSSWKTVLIPETLPLFQRFPELALEMPPEPLEQSFKQPQYQQILVLVSVFETAKGHLEPVSS